MFLLHSGGEGLVAGSLVYGLRRELDIKCGAWLLKIRVLFTKYPKSSVMLPNLAVNNQTENLPQI